MLKKITLVATMSAIFSAASLATFAADGLTLTGEFRPYLYNGSGVSANGNTLNNMGIQTYAETFFNYTKTVGDWTATGTLGLEWLAQNGTRNALNGAAGQSNEPGNTAAGFDYGENWNAGMHNASFGIALGNTQYLGSPANYGGWIAAYDYDSNAGPAVGAAAPSMVDDGDLSGRGVGTISAQITSVPGVEIKFGLGTISSQADANTGTATASSYSAKTNSASEEGVLVDYSNADLKVGLMYVADNTTCDANTGAGACGTSTPVGPVPAAVAASSASGALVSPEYKVDTAKAEVAGSYNLKSATNVPLNLWLGAWNESHEVDSKKDGQGFTGFSLGVSYSNNGWDAGFDYESLTFDKPDANVVSTTANTTGTAGTGSFAVLWVDYEILPGTKIWGTYDNSVMDKNSYGAAVVHSATASGKDQVVSGLLIGLNQAF